MILLNYFYIFLASGALGSIIVIYLMNRISKIKVDNAKAEKIASAIHEGAMTFLKEEYRIIFLVVGLIAVILGLVSQTFVTPAVFIVGALLSMITGLIGMQAATKANVRTTMAAKEKGEHAAFIIALFGGGVMGFAVATLGSLGLGTIFYLFYDSPNFIQILTSFTFGASLVAFFARVGGGIYTKSADVGADLVGKIEIGIPEDDPRNPAVIADNVGDCVGDTAGMGADIYESYLGAMVSAIIIALNQFGDIRYVTLPLMLSVLGLVSSVLGLASNLLFKLEPAAMLRNATYVAIAFLILSSYFYINYAGIEFSLFYSIVSAGGLGFKSGYFF